MPGRRFSKPGGLESITVMGNGRIWDENEEVDLMDEYSVPDPCGESEEKKLEREVPGKRWYERARDHISVRPVENDL